MSTVLDEETIQGVRRLATAFPDLRLLVLHGSRARGDAHGLSDWDFAFLGSPDLDVLELRRRLVDVLGTDDLDLVNLGHCGGLLRYRIARDGILLFESAPDAFDDFRIEAALFWFDMEPVVRREQAALLKSLG